MLLFYGLQIELFICLSMSVTSLVFSHAWFGLKFCLCHHREFFMLAVKPTELLLWQCKRNVALENQQYNFIHGQ